MKPIIIVRYFLGTGGRFLCTLLSSLIEPVELVEPHRAHLNTDHDRHHNYNQKDSPIEQYTIFTHLYQTPAELQQGTEFFRNTVKFGKEFNGMPDPDMFIVGCHAYNPEPMIRAWPTGRVINITLGADDLDQISYNWITKNVIQESRPKDLIDLLGFLHQQWPRHMRPVTVSDIDWNDVRNLSFITRWLSVLPAKRFDSVSQRLSARSNVLNIKFSDIHTGQLMNHLDQIIKFCGITVAPERRANALRLIQQYSAAQTPVPWSLDTDPRPSS